MMIHFLITHHRQINQLEGLQCSLLGQRWLLKTVLYLGRVGV